jgi:hypothetical protein
MEETPMANPSGKTRSWTRLCGFVALTAVVTVAGCPQRDDDASARDSASRSADPGRAGGGSAAGATDPAGSADAADVPGDPSGGSTGGGSAPADGGAAGSLTAFVAPLQAQLADRFFEFGSSSIAGNNSLTGILKLSLCGFGNARVVEQNIFSGATPELDLGFDSETVTEGVWTLVDAGNAIAIEVRDFALGGAQGALLKRFTVDFDAAANLLGVDGRQILSTDDIAAGCRQAQQLQQQIDAAAADLVNRRVVLIAGPDRDDIVLCESGNYGLKAQTNGQTIILEGGRWSIAPTDSGIELVLASDPAFDPSGQTFTSRLAITRSANGGLLLGGNVPTLTALNGNCETAIQTLLQ